MSFEIEAHITGELDRAGIEYYIYNDFINVSCPFHEHSGTKKKLGFSRTTGGMSCFVCGQKGHYNLYAEKMGLKGINSDSPAISDFSVLSREIERIEQRNKRGPESPDYLMRFDRPHWRRLPADFLRDVPSYEWYDEASKGHRILWPIYMNGVFKGCTSARIDPDAPILPKTRNLGGMDAARILFLFDHPLVKASRTLALVEGQFDALRFLYHGIPTSGILGAGAWDPWKLTIIAARGVKRLILAFDGDLAGERLTDIVLPQAEQLFEDVRVMHFPDPDAEERDQGIKSIDPGNCKLKYIKVVKRMVRL